MIIGVQLQLTECVLRYTLKCIVIDSVSVHLVNDDFSLSQSLAIIDYLEATQLGLSLYPNEVKARAKVQAVIVFKIK